jgi:hypothetical protein
MAIPILVLAALVTGAITYAVGRNDAGSRPSAPPTAAVTSTTVSPPSTAPVTTAGSASSAPPTADALPATPPTQAAATTVIATTTPAVTAPASTSPPTTTQPPTSTRTTAAPPTSNGARPDTAAVEGFIRRYYKLVGEREYSTAWSLLTPEFQQGRPGSYQEYVDFWDTIRDVKVLAVDVVPGTGWPVVTRLAMRYTTANGVVDELDELTLQPGPDGSPLVADNRPLHPL